jgi:uncharacterized protein DUF4349
MTGWRSTGRAVSRAVRVGWRRRAVRLPLAGIALVVLLGITWTAAVASVATSGGAVPSGQSGAARYGAGGAPGPEGRAGEASTPAAAPLIDERSAPEARAKGYSPSPAPPGAPVDVSGAEQDRQVARTARLALTVADLPSVAGRVRGIAAGVGGYLASEQSQDRPPASSATSPAATSSTTSPTATFTLRIPATRLDEVIGQLAGAGRVTERSEQADDVTDQVADLDGRLAAQRASVTRVRALLDKAETVGDVVMIESELTQREAALESLTKRLAAVTGRVAMSTLTVALTPEPAPEDRAGTGFLGGLASGWKAFLAIAGGLTTAFGAALPFLVLLVLLAGAWLAARRLVRKRHAPSADGA